MTDEQYIDIAIDISKKANSKIVYAATLQDSNDYYCPEMITDIDELVKYGNTKIEIIKELHREKAVEVLKERGK